MQAMNNIDWTLVAAWAMVIIVGLGNLFLIRQNRSLISAVARQAQTGFEQARVMRLQFDAMIRGVERPKINELAKHVVKPFIDELNTEILLFERSRISPPRRLTVWGDEGLINDLERRRPGLKKMVKAHDRDSEVLNAKIDDLKRMINTSEFRERCREIIKRYNDAVPLEKRLVEDQDSCAEQFTYFVIQNRKDLGNIYGQSNKADFWRIHGSEFLKARERENVENTIKEVESLCDEYVGKARELREKLVQLREEWVANFNLLREEIGQTL